MRIITVSREFGSGGREIGKRLAEILGFDYYDKEIISRIAEKCGVNEDWAEYVLQNNFAATAPITVNRTFHMTYSLNDKHIQLMRQQTDTIKEIATKGRDFVIVGRNADMILSQFKPLNIFVCADMQSKLKRCMDRMGEDENLTEKAMLKKIKQIDKSRMKTREMISDSPWGDRHTYSMTINTTGWDMADLAPIIANFATTWFEKFHD